MMTMIVLGAKKFGLKEAGRAVAFAKAQGKTIGPEVVFGVGVTLAALGVANVAADEARAEADRQAEYAKEARRNALHAEAVGVTKVEAFRKRCDKAVAAINELVIKIVDGIATHYRNAVARAEAKAKARAELYNADARLAETARADAQEIVDTF